jgi:hypothetical protein
MHSATSKRERILILVKTYPALSTKYDELVCTAGMTPEGKWIRLYPIPFRKLELDKRYGKYQWVELEITKNTSDPRPESYRPVKMCEDITFHGEVGTEEGWIARKSIVLRNVYDDMDRLIAVNKGDDGISLAVFKPARIINFTVEETDRSWDPAKLKAIEVRAAQLNLFGGEESPFQIVSKLPYIFRYVFEDARGRQSTLMIEDWEIGSLYWNCLERAGGDEKVACQKVREKYFDLFRTRDLYFFLGTSRQFDSWARNPFLIIGCFWPPIPNPALF